jgi:hypothetical protein
VGVGSTGVDVGVSITTGAGVSVGVPVAVGAGVSVGVGVKVGFGVLVGVAVTVGARAMKDATGQLQLMVTIIPTDAIPRTVTLFLFKSSVPLPRLRGYCLPTRHFSSPLRNLCPRYYLLAYSKTIFSNCPPSSQLVKTMSSVSDCGTGLS